MPLLYAKEAKTETETETQVAEQTGAGAGAKTDTDKWGPSRPIWGVQVGELRASLFQAPLPSSAPSSRWRQRQRQKGNVSAPVL